MRSVGVLDSDKPLVLVVDDEAALAAMLRYNLERHGFLVEHATNGRAALVRIAESRPDLVLLDWTLPAISGIEVCRQLRSRPDTRDLRVIMVTGRTGDQDAVRGLDAGADDYVVKPFSVDPPSAAAEEAVAGRYSFRLVGECLGSRRCLSIRSIAYSALSSSPAISWAFDHLAGPAFVARHLEYCPGSIAELCHRADPQCAGGADDRGAGFRLRRHRCGA